MNFKLTQNPKIIFILKVEREETAKAIHKKVEKWLNEMQSEVLFPMYELDEELSLKLSETTIFLETPCPNGCASYGIAPLNGSENELDKTIEFLTQLSSSLPDEIFLCEARFGEKYGSWSLAFQSIKGSITYKRYFDDSLEERVAKHKDFETGLFSYDEFKIKVQIAEAIGRITTPLASGRYILHGRGAKGSTEKIKKIISQNGGKLVQKFEDLPDYIIIRDPWIDEKIETALKTPEITAVCIEDFLNCFHEKTESTVDGTIKEVDAIPIEMNEDEWKTDCTILKCKEIFKHVEVIGAASKKNRGVYLSNVIHPVSRLVVPGTVEGLPVHFGGISNRMFKHLERVVLLDGVVSIESAAFAHCKTLKSVEIPPSVKKIEFNAFKNCKLLEKVRIPDAILEIGSNAFYGCQSLTIYGSVSNLTARRCARDNGVPFKKIE